LHNSNNTINNILSDKCPGVFLLHGELTRRKNEKLLTNGNIGLLQVIREKKPESISELARLLDRSQSNVSNDVKYLEEIGLLELEEKKGPILHKKPIVDYDVVRITVDLSC